MANPHDPSTQSAAARFAHSLRDSGASSLASPEFASYMDTLDPLASIRGGFSFPTKAVVWPEKHRLEMESRGSKEGDETAVYMAGNSLGLMPNAVTGLITEELEAWKSRGVLGHTEHPHQRPWVTIDEHVTPVLANLVGAKTSEVACMGSLTANLHTLFTSFYKPTPTRHKIMYEGKAFPSDIYAFASQVAVHDYPPSSLLPVDPLPGEFALRTSEILKIIEDQGDSIAVICFGAIQYYSGECFAMKEITAAGHAKGCIVAFDCAHAVGNVPLSLHDWGVDFACWCSYKYLNAGPGAIAGLYVHERWSDRNRLTGWWGHDLKTRFDMPSTFSPTPGAAGWQFSNPSVLDVISLFAALKSFTASSECGPKTLDDSPLSAGSLPILRCLRAKGMDVTTYLEALLQSSPHFVPLADLPSQSSRTTPHFTIITPSDPSCRGSQLSLLFQPVEIMEPVFEGLRERGVIGDERRPGVIRIAPVPMYTRWEDCRLVAAALEAALAAIGV